LSNYYFIDKETRDKLNNDPKAFKYLMNNEKMKYDVLKVITEFIEEKEKRKIMFKPIITLEDKETTKYNPLIKEIRRKAKKQDIEVRLTIVFNGKDEISKEKVGNFD